MPQMSPLNWFILLLFFIMTFFLFNMINYYNFMYNPNNKNKQIKYNLKNMNWKW
uniref:ATP synthase complex subunit 8 n=1 Tax=Orfelia nemoralis TaxID=1588145 RepID=A0A7U3RWZ0_9DIPT|nr:ATP synthase F0 subunit 8 [Orfelia nemoralis]